MALAPSVQNRVQNVFPPRAAQYFSGVALAASTTLDLKREFKGLGALQAYSDPLGTPVTAFMLPSVSARSLGFPLQVQISVGGTTSTAASAVNVVVFEL
jgi:hypothetical protein